MAGDTPTATDFTWIDGERLVRFAPDAAGETPALLEGRGFGGYALLSTARARTAAPAVVDGAALVVDVPGGPVDAVAAEIRAEVTGHPVVALGGGRVIDSAKAIAGADGLACAAIPTTLSGAEMTRFHRMPAGFEGWQLTRPSLVVADAGLMGSQPMPGIVASAMNALAHAMEALYTPLTNPVASAAALLGAQELAAGLAADELYRPRLALGALLAGYATGSAGLAVHHIICQTIVRVCQTPHAQTNAVMLPHVARLMERNALAPMGAFAHALGVETGQAADRVTELAACAGVTRLSDLGVTAAALPSVEEGVFQRPDLANSPGPPTLKDIHELLEGAL